MHVHLVCAQGKLNLSSGSNFHEPTKSIRQLENYHDVCSKFYELICFLGH